MSQKYIDVLDIDDKGSTDVYIGTLSTAVINSEETM